jgi:hypothetical protein
MIRAALNEPADLFIGHNLPALPAVVHAASRRGVRVGFDVEDFHSGMWLSSKGPSLSSRLAEYIERTFLPQCSYVTAASPGISSACVARYGIKMPTTILNVFPLSQRPKGFRAHDPKAPLTLYWFSQVIGASRGLEDVVQAMALASTKNIELHLRGEWQPGYEKSLRQSATNAGLSPAQLVSHELAPPDDMIRLSAQYDVGLALEQPVSENRDICLTNKIFTYLLAGNAVIATATSGQQRLMSDMPGSGLCYKIGDVKTLGRQLREWEYDRTALENARLRAWQYGEQTYNWDIEQQTFVAAVEQALAARACV